MIKVCLLDGTIRYCSVIEFTWDGMRMILDEGEEYIDPMEVLRIVPIK